MKISIQLAELRRFTKNITVDVPVNLVKQLGIQHVASEIYHFDEEDDWQMDDSWGAEEGTHGLIAMNVLWVSADYRVLEDGTVEKV
jgi:hypothetical protein